MKLALLLLGLEIAVHQPLMTAQSGIRLLESPMLSKSAQSLPRISKPTPAQVKINESLRLLDKSARELARSCRGRSAEGEQMSFDQSVQTIFRGPLFLSFSLIDQVDCGGVHPYLYDYTITFNLETGEQVDWTEYLKNRPIEQVKVNPGDMLPLSLLGVRSPSLQKAYAAGWQDDEQCHLSDIEDPSEVELTVFLVSPADKKAGLSIIPAQLASRSAGCAREVVLGEKMMNLLGVPESIESLLLSQKKESR